MQSYPCMFVSCTKEVIDNNNIIENIYFTSAAFRIYSKTVARIVFLCSLAPVRVTGTNGVDPGNGGSRRVVVWTLAGYIVRKSDRRGRGGGATGPANADLDAC